MILLDSLAVVLPRYGKSLGGGAETLVRELALQLAQKRGTQGPLVSKVEVWTTCAKDHRTWANEHEPGVTEEDGLIVRRFAVDERDLEIFIRAELALQDGRSLNIDEQLGWLQNGVNSRALYAHIAEFGREFSALMFAPYLFPTTFWGSLIYPEKSLLVPCLHNEAYAYFPVFNHMFSEVRGLLFNAPPEGDLAAGLYTLPDMADKSAVVGMGFDAVPPATKVASATNTRKSSAPYLLYSGRKETGKNLDLLIRFFQAYRTSTGDSTLELRLIGSGKIEFLEALPEGVIDLGFVSEEEKNLQMRDALALCQPSVNESFSIVMMEAWLHGTPVLVHGGCAVTRHHCEQGGGGMYFSNELEFIGAVCELLRVPQLRNTLGTSGTAYVQREYSWDAVLTRFADAMQRFGLSVHSPAIPQLKIAEL